MADKVDRRAAALAAWDNREKQQSNRRVLEALGMLDTLVEHFHGLDHTELHAVSTALTERAAKEPLVAKAKLLVMLRDAVNLIARSKP